MISTRKQRRGISLIMVTAVIAVASVMGMAMLSSSSLQSEAYSSQSGAARADGLAESGINLGIYYLQNLDKWGAAPWPGATLAVGNTYGPVNLNLGSSIPDTFDLSIQRLTPTRYLVTSTGNSATSLGTLQHTLSATVDVNYFNYGVSATNASALLSSNLPANTTINGDVYSNGPVNNNANVTGSIYAANGGLLGGLLKLVTGVVATLIPSPANVNHFNTYTYKGVRYSAKVITSLSDIPAYPDPATNPAGIYLRAGSLDLTGNVNINGTLVLSSGGTLGVKGINNSITPVSGFPALVVDTDISFKINNSALNLNGLVYLGGKVAPALLVSGSKLNVNGGMLFAGSSINIASGVVANISYDRVKASVPDIVSTGNAVPASVSIVAWKN